MTEVLITVLVAIFVYLLLATFTVPLLGLVGAILVLVAGLGSARL